MLQKIVIYILLRKNCAFTNVPNANFSVNVHSFHRLRNERSTPSELDSSSATYDRISLVDSHPLCPATPTKKLVRHTESFIFLSTRSSDSTNQTISHGLWFLFGGLIELLCHVDRKSRKTFWNIAQHFQRNHQGLAPARLSLVSVKYRAFTLRDIIEQTFRFKQKTCLAARWLNYFEAREPCVDFAKPVKAQALARQRSGCWFRT